MTPEPNFPERIILDLEDVFWPLRMEVHQVTQGATVDWDAFFDQLFGKLRSLPSFNQTMYRTGMEHDELRQLAEEMAYGDLLIANMPPGFGLQARLYALLMRAFLLVKEQMLITGAYYQGHFPYFYTTMVTDGCLLFSRDDRAATTFLRGEHPF